MFVFFMMMGKFVFWMWVLIMNFSSWYVSWILFGYLLFVKTACQFWPKSKLFGSFCRKFRAFLFLFWFAKVGAFNSWLLPKLGPVSKQITKPIWFFSVFKNLYPIPHNFVNLQTHLWSQNSTNSARKSGIPLKSEKKAWR